MDAAVLKAPAGMAVSALDPYDLNNILTPYPLQEALRGLGEIAWLERYGTCMVARYKAVGAVLENPTRFISSGGVGLSDIRKPDSWRPKGPIAEVDPPEHDKVRQAMNRIVAPGIIKGWEAAFRQVAQTLCDTLGPQADGVAALAEPFVLTAFTSALGVELHRENLIIAGNHSFNAAGPRNALFEESLKKSETISDWFAHNQTREAMRPGGFGAAVFAAEAAGDLPPGSAGPMLRTLIRGGMDTTISAIGTMLRLLAQAPQWWQAACANRALLGPIFDEALRLESPVQSIYRTTAQPVEFAGFTIPEGVKIQVMLGAANRDPAAWEEASEFRPGRPGRAHLGFGAGPHFCLGRNIARLEVKCLFDVLLDRFARIELAGAPRYRPLNVLRTLDTLPLLLARG